MIRLDDGDFGTYLVTDLDTGKDILVQTDWDYPSLASNFGWDIMSVQRRRNLKCPHSGTDGTVDCPDCGVTATEFIAAAGKWLDDNTGIVAEDPGYWEE